MKRVTMQASAMDWKEEEPVAVLYETALRSLSRARQYITEDDQIGRVMEVKKITDILTYLQASLRTEAGRGAALSLSDFYAAMFTLTLEASRCESTEGLDEVISYMSQVRDAWALSTEKPKAGRGMLPGMRPYPVRAAAMLFHA